MKNNTLSKEKCEHCEKHNAKYECEECGYKICGYCASKCEYQCFVCPPPEFIKIKKQNEKT